MSVRGVCEECVRGDMTTRWCEKGCVKAWDAAGGEAGTLPKRVGLCKRRKCGMHLGASSTLHLPSPAPRPISLVFRSIQRLRRNMANRHLTLPHSTPSFPPEPDPREKQACTTANERTLAQTPHYTKFIPEPGLTAGPPPHHLPVTRDAPQAA